MISSQHHKEPQLGSRPAPLPVSPARPLFRSGVLHTDLSPAAATEGDRGMAPRQAQQQKQQKPASGGGGSGGSGGSGGGKPAGGPPAGPPKMNYFAALAGTADAESQLEEIAAEEDRRRQASSSGSSGANGRKAGGGEGEGGGGLKQPLVWIDLGAPFSLSNRHAAVPASCPARRCGSCAGVRGTMPNKPALGALERAATPGLFDPPIPMQR